MQALSFFTGVHKVAVALVLGLSAVQGSAAPTPTPDFPLPVNQERSTTARQLEKPVLAARLLDDMESPANWRLFGPGEMAFTTDRQRDGQKSLRLTSPTKGVKPPAVQGRPFGESGIRRDFQREDWSGYNRISIWVYPDLPGFKVVSLLVKLQSEGTVGRSYTDGGLHFVLVRNQEWNQITWEIAHLERTQVEAVEFIYRLQGNEPGACERVSFDFDHLELQRVAPEYFRGWGPAPGLIAYNQVGYAPDYPKIAFVAPGSGSRFEVVNVANGRRVWEGAVEETPAEVGVVGRMDFSAFQRPGTYRLRVGSAESGPFRIRKDPWRDTLVAGLSFFYSERCGYAVRGVHDVCHQDWRVEHNGRSLPIDGGWHDAGDLSQGLVNTSEAVWSMLRLADRLESSEAGLARRFHDEARWGAAWMLKTRFGDGHRVTWATMDFWTDGLHGNVDDVVVKAGDSPFENFIAAGAEAAAARAFARLDPGFSEQCRLAAEGDYRFAIGRTQNPGIEVAAAAAQASVELYRLTRSESYRTQAVALARIILDCQQVETPAWEKPLAGFFYTSPRRERPLLYNHRSHEQGPIVALVDLCRALPREPEAERWRAGVARYGDYLLAAARMTAPYHMTPAGIYRIADTGDTNQQRQIREGIRLAEGVYLRRFPVWSDFRGNLGVQLSQATAAAAAGRLLNAPELQQLAREQMEWALGRNPFGQSLMYGVGWLYAPQYTAMSGDMAGSLPVGIQSRLHEDVPYWPTANCYNYAEVWVHPVSRWFSTAVELLPGKR
jgi:hypothetical protein